MYRVHPLKVWNGSEMISVGLTSLSSIELGEEALYGSDVDSCSLVMQGNVSSLVQSRSS